MNSDRERWKLAREEFERLRHLDAARRSTRLEELRRIEAPLADELASLLQEAATSAVDGFLEPPSSRESDEDSQWRPDPFPPGSSMGPFVIKRLLGRGGMGRVYLAERQGIEGTGLVALKVMRTTGIAKWMPRFQLEQSHLSRLAHPNVVRLLDGGVTPQGTPYLVIEYVDGLPLDRFCERHLLPLEARVRLVLDVCRAVAHAHERGIVHRDLKPANVLVTSEGVPKVTDFGLAGLIDEPSAVRGSPRVSLYGTPAFMAPEVILGAAEGDATSDCYSLGAVLYRLIAGRSPFVGRTLLETCFRATTEDPPPIGRIPGVTRELETIVVRSMEPDPTRRIGTVLELAEQLERYLDGRPLSIRRPPWWSRYRRLASRRRVSRRPALGRPEDLL